MLASEIRSISFLMRRYLNSYKETGGLMFFKSLRNFQDLLSNGVSEKLFHLFA